MGGYSEISKYDRSDRDFPGKCFACSGGPFLKSNVYMGVFCASLYQRIKENISGSFGMAILQGNLASPPATAWNSLRGTEKK